MNNFLRVALISTLLLNSAGLFAMPYAEQQKAFENALNLLAKADAILKQKNWTAKNIKDLNNNLSQAFSTLNTFTGKSGKMPHEIEKIVELLRNPTNSMNYYVENPGKFSALIAAAMSMAIHKSQDMLNKEEVWLPLA